MPLIQRAGNVSMFSIKRKMEAEYAIYQDDNSFPMKPQRILSDIRKVMDEDDILISDVGAHRKRSDKKSPP